KIYTCDTCHADFSCLSRTLKTETLKLSLPLLVLRVGTNHPNHSAAMNHLALVTNLFHTCTNFHNSCSSPADLKIGHYKIIYHRGSPQRGPLQLLTTVNDSPAGQIVRRKLHRHFVSGQNPDEILAHL